MYIGSMRETSIFFFNDTAPTEIYTLSLHDALPICAASVPLATSTAKGRATSMASPTLSAVSPPERTTGGVPEWRRASAQSKRSEEHTSELQSRQYLVCRLLLEKKKRFVCDRNHISG